MKWTLTGFIVSVLVGFCVYNLVYDEFDPGTVFKQIVVFHVNIMLT